jgi:uncharacterized repeat protein (TIGR03803 family)
VILSVLLVIAVRSAQAQSETLLYSFTGGSDGGEPSSYLTADHKGNFYGTTQDGGLGYGTVFELSPNGGGGWTETVLYSFTGGTDGGSPYYSAVIFDEAGNLYGTASSGGEYGSGVVFELSPAGTSWTETVLYSFAGGTGDGANPRSGLIMGSAGTLYGTTTVGGSNGNGVVFGVVPSGGKWTEQVIYNAGVSGGNFNGITGGLTIDAADNIFGVTWATVFELSPIGGGGWKSAVIHAFAGAPKDGGAAYGTPVLDPAGNLYGTTFLGGKNNIGAVYKLSPAKKGKWTKKIVYSFAYDNTVGNEPYAGVVLDAEGNIYGTTTGGGEFNIYGTVFELAVPVGKGGYKAKSLWSFNGSDGSEPADSLTLDSKGNLYGTTWGGGIAFDTGVVFEITP